LDQLEKVLGSHPKFEGLADLISNGMDYRFKKEISKEEQLRELHGMMERGNHKLTKNGADTATTLLTKDPAQGFFLPISLKRVMKIRGAMVQPLGLASQFVLAADGSKKKNKRQTQDLMFSLSVV
jgi:hypothetical protein